MRSILCTALFVLPALPAPAADPPKPNTLTPQESADGWLLLFDGETTFGWNVTGEAKVDDGVLVLGGDKETTVKLSFGYFEAYWERRWEGKDQPRCVLTAHGKKGGTPSTAGMGFSHATAAGKVQWAKEHWKVQADPTVTVSSDSRVNGSTESGMVIDTTIKFAPDCRIAVDVTVPAGTKLFLRNVKLKPAGLKAIFNGKDLTGWKEFPGKKSKFTVTPEGWINIKNGPGDLQTLDQWDDFLLQIDCLSNGKHLNSGVFFRCRPDEYQQGYEAQIHNGFRSEPDKDYTIEEYDPVTHKLMTKKKVKYAAIDYGTGAIYRRMPARRQVAKDYEWFTMTVLAQGRHLAVWVNGIQVTDWTDNRPLNENARNGCKLGKGPISLQGHDPTTDLSFRNIRIVELPKTNGKE
jgi:hypothetical protein